MADLISMNAYIVAGGSSKRMRIDKALLKLDGVSFIDITVSCVFKLFDKIYIVGRQHEDPRISASYEDDIQDIGPIGGIYTALKRTDKEFNFFIGIDYPFINPEIIVLLAGYLLEKPSKYQGLIPVTPDGPHPLFAFYSKSCLASIEKCIAQMSYQIRCLSLHSNILYLHLRDELGTTEYSRLKKSFININSDRDYKDLIKEKSREKLRKKPRKMHNFQKKL